MKVLSKTLTHHGFDTFAGTDSLLMTAPDQKVWLEVLSIKNCAFLLEYWEVFRDHHSSIKLGPQAGQWTYVPSYVMPCCGSFDNSIEAIFLVMFTIALLLLWQFEWFLNVSPTSLTLWYSMMLSRGALHQDTWKIDMHKIWLKTWNLNDTFDNLWIWLQLVLWGASWLLTEDTR